MYTEAYFYYSNYNCNTVTVFSMPSRYCLFKLNNGNIKTMFKSMYVVLVSLSKTSRKFHTFFCCFHCRVSTSKWRLGVTFSLNMNNQNTIFLLNVLHFSGLPFFQNFLSLFYFNKSCSIWIS